MVEASGVDVVDFGVDLGQRVRVGDTDGAAPEERHEDRGDAVAHQLGRDVGGHDLRELELMPAREQQGIELVAGGGGLLVEETGPEIPRRTKVRPSERSRRALAGGETVTR